MVRDFHRIIGLEAREQVLERTGRLPDAVAACVGGGSNAIGIFHAFLDDPGVRLVGLEPGGDGIETGRHGATLTAGSPGALHGAMSYLLQDEDGQTIESHSISAGLDYPGVGPEHALLKDLGRAEYRPITDAAGDGRVRAALPHRGHHPGHRVGARRRRRAASWAASSGPDGVVLVNLSGRGDKDVDTAAKWFGMIGRAESAEQASGTAIAEGGAGAGRAAPEQLTGRRARPGACSDDGAVEEIFAGCRAEGRAALVGYLPAGYPTVDGSVELLDALVDGGCDLVEVGMPYSDPVMDGPTIQAAAETALRGRYPAARRAVGRRAGDRGRWPGGGDDLLQPGAALRRRRVRPRPGRRRRARA